MTFPANAIAWFAQHGVTVERVMSNNGSAYVSYRFRDLCEAIKVGHFRIRPQTNGTVERFIQTLLREWAYRLVYKSSEDVPAGSLRTFTSTTFTELTQRFRTMPRSVAWIGTTS